MGLRKPRITFREIDNRTDRKFRVWNDWITKQRPQRRMGNGAIRTTTKSSDHFQEIHIITKTKRV